MKKQVNRINEIDYHVGKRLGQLRIAAGLSQEQLAHIAGVSYQQIQKYESGQNRVSASKLYVFARYFGVSADTFYPDDRSHNEDEPFLTRIKGVFQGTDERHLPAIEAFASVIKQVR
ncbi:MAG: helix-turn-helix domain-containing protein [Alphaproteobacteria bacterium]